MLLCDVYQCSVNNISNLLSYVTVRRHDEEEKKCWFDWKWNEILWLYKKINQNYDYCYRQKIHENTEKKKKIFFFTLPPSPPLIFIPPSSLHTHTKWNEHVRRINEKLFLNFFKIYSICMKKSCCLCIFEEHFNTDKSRLNNLKFKCSINIFRICDNWILNEEVRKQWRAI